jgi:hypothetical protein
MNLFISETQLCIILINVETRWNEFKTVRISNKLLKYNKYILDFQILNISNFHEEHKKQS